MAEVHFKGVKDRSSVALLFFPQERSPLSENMDAVMGKVYKAVVEGAIDNRMKGRFKVTVRQREQGSVAKGPEG